MYILRTVPHYCLQPYQKKSGAGDGNRYIQERRLKRLMCSVGDKPTEEKVRDLVAWTEGERETNLSSIDKAIFGMVSNSSGRNDK